MGPSMRPLARLDWLERGAHGDARDAERRRKPRTRDMDPVRERGEDDGTDARRRGGAATKRGEFRVLSKAVPERDGDGGRRRDGLHVARGRDIRTGRSRRAVDVGKRARGVDGVLHTVSVLREGTER